MNTTPKDLRFVTGTPGEVVSEEAARYRLVTQHITTRYTFNLASLMPFITLILVRFLCNMKNFI